jgi:HAD superfamily hydrolase (TIGR01450 family)
LTVLCDLDGVLYRGVQALPGVPEALRKLIASGVGVYFITNNSTRTAQGTAAKITEVTGVEVEADQVLTSSMAATTLLEPTDEPVLIVGEEGVRHAVEQAGLAITADPSAARAVVVGLTRALTYETLTGAMQAIMNGARFVATNDDKTFPTADGLAPGSGAIVAAISAASGTVPEVAGKPNPAIRDLIRAKVDGDVWMIGDRLDTDIAMASMEPGWRSVLVLTGVSDGDARRDTSADFVVDDFPAAVDLVLGHLQQS